GGEGHGAACCGAGRSRSRRAGPRGAGGAAHRSPRRGRRTDRERDAARGGRAMKPARWPREDALRERLLHVDPRAGTLQDAHIADLPRLLRAGDLLVVNDAATLPASLQGRAPGGSPIEVRLVAERPDGAFRAVLFGPGDWRTPTEHRAPPPPFRHGQPPPCAAPPATVDAT